MTIHLSATQIQAIRQQAEGAYPQECCGLLLGAVQMPGDTVVAKVWPVPNAWSDAVVQDYGLPETQPGVHDRGDRYWIDPQDLLQAQRYGRDHQMQVIGVYHSHPDHPAHPSECDRQLAWSDYTYLIVSLQQGTVHEALAWSLDPQHQFQAEPLIIHEPPNAATATS